MYTCSGMVTKTFLWQYFSVNICLGPNEDRYLVTGLHTVNDIYCSCCQQILGWRYVSTNIIGLSCDNDYLIFIDSCLAVDIVAKLLYKTRQKIFCNNLLKWDKAEEAYLSFLQKALNIKWTSMYNKWKLMLYSFLNRNSHVNAFLEPFS